MGCCRASNEKKEGIELDEYIFEENEDVIQTTESKCIENKTNLKYVKNKYILRQIFIYLQKKNVLELIKYNKKIQKRLDININDYKNYSKIEIEIIPFINETGKFINILKYKERPYFHIYFNDEEKEINRNYLKKKDDVKKIIIKLDKEVESLVGLFHEYNCIESINFRRFYRDNINNMSNMFFRCHSLKELNLSNFNTDNVTNMSNMFYECSSLKELNLCNFNTNKVTNMSHIFSRCASLKELNLSNFNNNNVKDMTGMFEDCSSLLKLDLHNLNINNVKYKNKIFDGCPQFKELNLYNFSKKNLLDIKLFLAKCSSELKINNF